MNKRDFLKSAAAALVVPVIGKAQPKDESEPFEPDVVIDLHHPLFGQGVAYLDGKDMTFDCFAAFIKEQSFERPTFGEIAVYVRNEKGEILSIRHRDLKPGEFWHNTAIAKRLSGQVYIKLSEHGKELLGHLREAGRLR